MNQGMPMWHYRFETAWCDRAAPGVEINLLKFAENPASLRDCAMRPSPHKCVKNQHNEGNKSNCRRSKTATTLHIKGGCRAATLSFFF